MRMSCNGCRVLRKGCSENCSIRSCLQWIKSPDSQAHATVFLAKFYGRAGLMNLINAGPDHLRPAIFRSLLYEACGRIVNPIYGSVGLLWSGQWQLCQNAVEAVLKGAPITPIATEAAAMAPPVKGCDIRHVTKDENSKSDRVKPTRTRFKRSGSSKNSSSNKVSSLTAMMAAANELIRAGSSTSHDSTVSHPDEAATSVASVPEADVEERGNDCEGDGELELELTLGFGFDPVQREGSSGPKSCEGSRVDGGCTMGLRLV